MRAAAVTLVRALMILHGVTLEELGLAEPKGKAAPKLADAPPHEPPVAAAATPVAPVVQSPLKKKATRVNRRTDLGSFAVKPSEAPRAAVVERRDGVKVTVCPAAQDTRFTVDPGFQGGEFMADWRRRRGG